MEITNGRMGDERGKSFFCHDQLFGSPNNFRFFVFSFSFSAFQIFSRSIFKKQVHVILMENNIYF
jgi:hypothetical protein